MEKEGIISKDRERCIQQFSDELEIRKEEIVGGYIYISSMTKYILIPVGLTKQVDQLQSELGNKQTMISQLQVGTKKGILNIQISLYCSF